MSKSGILGTLLPVLGGVAALGTGLGAAGIGPLAGLFSAGDAAGAGAAAGAGGLADAGAAALPATAGGFDAGALGLGADVGTSALTQAGLPGLAGMGAVGSSGADLGAALPAATSLTGAALPLATDLLATAPSMSTGPADIMSAIGPAFDSPAAAGVASSSGFANPFDAGLAAAGTSGTGGVGGADVAAGDVAAGGGGSDAAGMPWWQNPNNLLRLAPLGLMGIEALTGGGLGGTVPGSAPVTQAAQTAATNEGILTGQGQQNISYVNTGALPAGAQASIDAAANAAKAQVRSSFASMGIPGGSTMEAENLAAVDQNAAAQKFAIQNQLLQSGISQFNAAGGFGSQVNQADLALMNAQILQEQELEQALASFAGATAASGGFTGTA